MGRNTSDLKVRSREETRDISAEPTARQFTLRNVGLTPLTSFRREMDELFADFSDRFAHFGDNRQLPALDVTETDAAYEIRAELPGVEEADIDITANGNRLTICGEKERSAFSETADSRISECAYGHYERSVRLPAEFEADDITAEYANGVLQMTVPKAQAAPSKAKTVKITSLKKS